MTTPPSGAPSTDDTRAAPAEERPPSAPTPAAPPFVPSVATALVAFPDGVAVAIARRGDAAIVRLDAEGHERWRVALASPGDDVVSALARDDAGAIIAVGWTTGALADGGAHGGDDLFVAKIDPAGARVWTYQGGTPRRDRARDVAVRGGDIYVVGSTQGALDGEPWAGSRFATAGPADDCAVIKLGGDGQRAWTRLIGTRELGGDRAGIDECTGVAVDEGGAIATGYAYGDLPGVRGGLPNVFVARFTAAGKRTALRRTGSGAERQVLARVKGGVLAGAAPSDFAGGLRLTPLGRGLAPGRVRTIVPPTTDELWFLDGLRAQGDGAVALGGIGRVPTTDNVVRPIGALLVGVDAAGVERWRARVEMVAEPRDLAIEGEAIYLAGATDDAAIVVGLDAAHAMRWMLRPKLVAAVRTSSRE